jgi:hypothetical protein
LRREFALLVRAFFVVNLGSDLRKKPVQSLGRSNRSLEGAALTESHYVLGRILETNAVGGAVGAQQLDAGSCEISFEAGNINLFLSSGGHLQLLHCFGG